MRAYLKFMTGLVAVFFCALFPPLLSLYVMDFFKFTPFGVFTGIFIMVLFYGSIVYYIQEKL